MQLDIKRRTYRLKSSTVDGRKRNSIISDEHYEETSNLIITLINNIKYFLLKYKTLSDNLGKIPFTPEEEEVKAKAKEFQEYKQGVMRIAKEFEKPLNQELTGAFVFRLCKEVSQWRHSFSFIPDLIDEVQGAFKKQKDESKLSIELIYFIVIQRINATAFFVIKDWKHKKADSKEVDQIKRTKLYSNVEKYRSLQLQKQRVSKLKQKMMEDMHRNIFNLYKGLQVVYLQPIVDYFQEWGDEENIKMLQKEQMKRNKRARKDITVFKDTHAHLLDKKRRYLLHQLNKKQNENGRRNSLDKKITINDSKTNIRSTKSKKSFHSTPVKNKVVEKYNYQRDKKKLNLNQNHDRVKLRINSRGKQNKDRMTPLRPLRPLIDKKSPSLKQKNPRLRL